MDSSSLLNLAVFRLRQIHITAGTRRAHTTGIAYGLLGAAMGAKEAVIAHGPGSQPTCGAVTASTHAARPLTTVDRCWSDPMHVPDKAKPFVWLLRVVTELDPVSSLLCCHMAAMAGDQVALRLPVVVRETAACRRRIPDGDELSETCRGRTSVDRWYGRARVGVVSARQPAGGVPADRAWRARRDDGVGFAQRCRRLPERVKGGR